jgi:hypothetical protein
MKRFAPVGVALTLSLGGCALTSETPLFKPSDAAAHGLAQGRWALYGPGCDVTPGEALPECAAPLRIAGNHLEPDGSGAADAMSALGPMAAEGAGGVASPSEFLLVDGDPQILQMRELPKAAKAGETDDLAALRAAKPGHRSYMAFRPLHRNAAGESDRGILWVVTCPKTEAVPGLKIGPSTCEATAPEGVRSQAKHLPPLFSFYMTWVSQ